MDYEQKYKEALERAKKYYNERITLGHTRDAIKEIFPELAESEDEKVRKEIIDFIYYKTDTYELREKSISWLAWLEKQGENKANKIPIWKHWKDGIAGGSGGEQIFLIKNGFHYSISSCLGYECDYIELSELDKLLSEKQGEQKPITSLDMEPEVLDKVVNDCIFGNETHAWSEEDEKKVNNLYVLLDQMVSFNMLSNKDATEFKDWLKSLKDRVQSQPMQEWSEEDKRMHQYVVNDLRFVKELVDDPNYAVNVERVEKEIDWMESLKERYTWKPSDEQIKACKEVYADLLSAKGFDVGAINSELNRLEEQLKKLREE